MEKPAAEPKKDSGFLEVADFIDVVTFDKERYPKGVRKYKVAQGDKAPVEEEAQG